MLALRFPPAGTTGKPKGVALSHAALHSQSMAKLLTVSQGAAVSLFFLAAYCCGWANGGRFMFCWVALEASVCCQDASEKSLA